jgi:hypothetical protein
MTSGELQKRVYSLPCPSKTAKKELGSLSSSSGFRNAACVSSFSAKENNESIESVDDEQKDI